MYPITSHREPGAAASAAGFVLAELAGASERGMVVAIQKELGLPIKFAQSHAGGREVVQQPAKIGRACVYLSQIADATDKICSNRLSAQDISSGVRFRHLAVMDKCIDGWR